MRSTTFHTCMLRWVSVPKSHDMTVGRVVGLLGMLHV